MSSQTSLQRLFDGVRFSHSTVAAHKGFDPQRSEGSVVVPGLCASTYVFPSAAAGGVAFEKAFVGDSTGSLIYQRVNHPGAEIAEERMTAMEPGAGSAAVFTCGMAAITTSIQALLKRDKVLLFINPVYGGTYDFFIKILGGKRDYHVQEVLATEPASIHKVIKSLGKDLGIVFMETPANPTLVMTDIGYVAGLAKKANPDCVVMVDNTFMGIFQQPFSVSPNVDVVIYSATKFIGGHSDLTAGFCLVRSGQESLMVAIKGERVDVGTILSPRDAHVLLSHMQTYKLRMESQAGNAQKVVEFLSNNRHIEKIHFPSLFDLDSEFGMIYAKQCLGPSSIITFWLKNANLEQTFKFLDILSASGIFALAVSLGGVETLICHPASTTHSEMSKQTQDITGITNNMVRLSVGQEDPNDLIKVLQIAFDNM